jgi:hypothetical protein
MANADFGEQFGLERLDSRAVIRPTHLYQIP